MSSRVQITNPAIISFYESNPHIEFETVNLLLLDLLQQVAGANWQSQLKTKLENGSSLSTTSNTEDKQKIEELRRFHTQLREDIHQTILRISSQFGLLKNAYVQEFRAIFPAQQSTGECAKLLADNNVRFNEKLRTILSEILKIRANGIADKAQNMLRQFQTILTANVQSVIQKETALEQVSRDFVDNYENNASCMMAAILQLITDYAAQKDTHINQTIEAIQRQDVGISSPYYKLIYELNDIVQQLQHETDDAHNSFDTTLSQLFPTASITSDRGSDSETAPTKYTILREDGTVPILIESHQIRDKNVGIQEIKYFFKSADEKMAHGVLISQYTGITGKPNYHLEIQHNRILVFLHKTEFSAEKVQHAVDIINTLSAKLSDLCLSTENKYTIPREVLDDINREYQHFIMQKDSITALLKEYNKKMLGQLDEIRFCSLDKFLSTRYSSCKKQGYLCDLCNVFTVGTLKGLAAHKRGCARKIGIANNSTEIIDTTKWAEKQNRE